MVQNPTLGLSLPAVRGRRDRIAHPEEARALIAALPEDDCALWATALYAGLRRGELQALRWQDVDLEVGLIRVERSWDQREGLDEPKSRAGRRRVPLVRPLRAELAAHRLWQGRGGEGLVLGRQGSAFASAAATRRAREAWADNELEPIGLHECRHTYASFMIAAGVNAKALSTYMGHSSITITLDRYGHLMPGSELEAAGLLETPPSTTKNCSPPSSGRAREACPSLRSSRSNSTFCSLRPRGSATTCPSTPISTLGGCLIGSGATAPAQRPDRRGRAA